MKRGIILFVIFFSIIITATSCTKDKEPPTVEILSPEEGETVTVPVVIEYFVSDNEVVDTVKLYINEEVYATHTGEGVWKDTVEDVSGDVSAVVEAYDKAENVGTDEVNFTAVLNTGQVSLISPPNGDTLSDTTPLLDWDQVEEAVCYQLQVDTTNTFTNPVLSESLSATITSYSISTPLEDRVYWWRVRAHGGTEWGNWSSVWSFVIASVPQLLSPENNDSTGNPTPTFKWSSIEDATEYEFVLDDDTTFSFPITNITTSATSYTPTDPLPDGTYYWKVRAKLPEGTGDWSSVNRLAIDAIPTLFSPENEETLRTLTITFTWSSIPGASSYTLTISSEDDTIEYETADTVYSVDLSGPGTYLWNVYAKGPWGPNPPSTSNAFTITAWETGPSLLTPCSSMGVATTSDYLYIMGGYDATGEVIATVEYYDPLLNRWSYDASMPYPRSMLGACCTDGSTIHVVGGFYDNTASSGHYIYQAGTWSTANDTINYPRYGLELCAIGDTLYAMGGYDPEASSVSAVVERLLPGDTVWSEVAPLSIARNCFASGVINGLIYIAGGGMSIAEEYDPVTDSWYSIASLPEDIYYAKGAVINGMFYVIGKDVNGALVMYAYDPTTNQWTAKENPSSIVGEEITDFGVGAINGKLMLIGGNVSGSTYIYDPTLDP